MFEVAAKGVDPHSILERGLAIVAGASSISSLLLYFSGHLGFLDGVRYVLLPGLALGVVTFAWAAAADRRACRQMLLSGVWSGLIATFAYDVVRLPIAHAGVPVFKAISYFGTILLDVPNPTLSSELAGWSYHVSNGVGFGLMYTALVRKPRVWSAVAWGLFLEAAMLVTPYAEIFGYKIGSQFLAVTIGGHVCYGLGLYGGLRLWTSFVSRSPNRRAAIRSRGLAAIGAAILLAGIGCIGADFHRLHTAGMPTSPPSSLDSHLYSTWDALEVDRVTAMWVLKRYVDPKAHFYFVSPFTTARFGIPFDLPEAEARRSGSQSTTEVLLARSAHESDRALIRIAAVAHHFEIMPWAAPSSEDERGLGLDLQARARSCRPVRMDCVEEMFAVLDTWYASAR
jgi:hypothetical protein